MFRYHIIFQGRVQGVGFRYFCQMNASTLGLTGYARNLDNGMVEVQVQGEKLSIENFINKIKIGNLFIKVSDYSFKKVALIPNENKFKILY